MLWFLVGLAVGVLVGMTAARQLIGNNVQTAYDTGYYDGRHHRTPRKVL